MHSFDAAVWRQRAGQRRRRIIHGGDVAAERDEAAIRGIARVLRWCNENGITVLFCESASGTYVDRQITVNARLSPVRQLHMLLHECGHHVVRSRLHETRFKVGYGDPIAMRRSTNAHRIDVLHEELEAWHEGLLLAVVTGVPIDSSSFLDDRSEFLKGYLR